jgi:response regulator RpfG family c-di-GMP phosphodiesterase
LTTVKCMAGSADSRSRADRLRTRELFACLARAGRFRDEETAEHVARMSRTCSLIANRLGLSRQECVDLLIASAMHDIGKIGIPDAVLLKPGALTAEERAIMERHTEIGSQILSGSSDPVMQLAATIALTHHERVDGGGYPGGLRDSQIPLSGRIAAVADVFDALTHDRGYRPAMRIDDALAIMHAQRGLQFDACVLDAFDDVLPRVLRVRHRYPNRAGSQSLGRYRGRSVSMLNGGHARSGGPHGSGLSVVSERPSGTQPPAAPGRVVDDSTRATTRSRSTGQSARTFP